MPQDRVVLVDGRVVTIRHQLRGIQFASAGGAALAAARAPALPALPARWQEALAANEMAVDDVLAPSITRTAALGGGSSDSPVEITIPPPPDSTLLLAVQIGEVVQWFLPTNAARLLPVHAGLIRQRDAAAVEGGGLRFLVPPNVLAPTAGAVADTAAAGIFGTVIHLIRIPIVRDLVDAGIAKVVEFIVRHVDTKQEGFRFLDLTRRDAVLQPPDLQAMRDQRVLLLVHGISAASMRSTTSRTMPRSWRI